MADEDVMENLSSLLIQLALQTREMSVKKEDTERQIQVCQVNIQQKKTYIEETKKSIEKVDEQIAQKQKTVQHYKENSKGLKRTYGLLMQYEKVLESELERRQENCDRDTKMYQDRIDSYKLVLKKHREQYHEHPLAQKLLKIQAENEEIERRIRACEDQIAARVRERQALQGTALNPAPQEDADDSVLLEQIELQVIDEVESPVDMKEPVSQSAGGGAQDEAAGLAEEKVEEVGSGDPNKGRGASPERGPMWASPASRAVHREVADMAQLMKMDQEDSFSVSGTAEGMDEECEGVTVESQGQDSPASATAAGATGAAGGEAAASEYSTASPPTPPSRMRAVLATPTFSLGPTGPLERSESSDRKSPGFVFSMTSDPSTPAFSGFGFDMGSTAQEETPFTFTSEYFSDKKYPESKFSGFPFDQSESRSEESFPFSFSSKSPVENSTSEGKAETSDGFPFSFSFPKGLGSWD